MKMLRKVKKAVCLALAGTSLLVTSASAQGYGISTHMGLNHEFDNDDCLYAAKTVNTEWIRDESRWKYMQNGKDETFTMRPKDIGYIKSAHEAGINQLLILGFGNTTYTGVGSESLIPTQSNAEYYQGYLDYVTATVNSVKDYVEAYEVWNEPNYTNFNYNDLASAEDYAKLYLDVKEIIGELDPTATVVCGSTTGTGGEGQTFADGVLEYISRHGGVNQMIDAFSIHIYEQKDEGVYETQLNNYETVFDKHGYTGDVWMTENGATVFGSVTENLQAQKIAKNAITWDNYLKTNNRSGVNFWYTLINKTASSEYENGFGLFYADYEIKPSGKAMSLHNKLTNDKTFASLTEVGTGKVAKYNGDSGSVYIMYDNKQRNTAQINLSGDIAYVYDYLGNVSETITNPTGTKSISLSSTPVYVECRNYVSKIKSVTYDENEGTLSVDGTFNGGDSVTIEVLQGGDVKATETAAVSNGKFSKWFSFDGDGEYTVRVGKAELTALGKSDVWAEETVEISGPSSVPRFDVSTEIVYNERQRKVSISGKVKNLKSDGEITVLAVPKSMNVDEVNLSAAAYVGQVEANNGSFALEFKLPKYVDADMAIYLGGTDITSIFSKDADVTESGLVYVSGLELNKGSALKVTASVQNHSDNQQEAMLMIAQYNGENLVDVKCEKKVIAAKTYTTIECSSANVDIVDGATKARAFIWNGTDSITPLFEKDEINL